MTTLHVTSIRSNVKRGADAQLKPKVLIVGPNGSGKTSLLHALSLACGGRVYDVAGADEVAGATDIVRHLGHGDEALWATAQFSDGSESTWAREGTTTTDPVSPMDFNMLASDLLTGTNEHKRAELQKLAAPLVTEDMYAAARRTYPDHTLALLDAYVGEDAGLSLKRPVERVLAVVESATAAKRAAVRREKDLQTTITAISGSAGMPVSDEDVAAAKAKVATLSTGAVAGAVSEAAQDQARTEKATAVEELNATGEEVTGYRLSLAQWTAYRDGLPAPAVSPYPPELLAGFETLVGYIKVTGADACFVCGSAVGHAHLDVQATGLAEFVATERAKSLPSPERADADRTIAQIHAQIGASEARRSGYQAAIDRADSVLRAPVASVHPAEISEAARIAAAYEARQQNHLRLTAAKTDQEAQNKRIKTLDAVITVANELRITLMKNASGMLAAEITKFMPTGTAFAIQEEGVHTLIGFTDRTNVFRSAASGAEEAAILIAIAAFRSAATCRGQVVVAPERQWSPDHLAAVMKAVEAAPCQVVIVSTVMPAGKIARSVWSVVETGLVKAESGVQVGTVAVAPPGSAVAAGLAVIVPPPPAPPAPPAPPSPHIPPIAKPLTPTATEPWLRGIFEPATDDDYPDADDAFDIVNQCETESFAYVQIKCGLVGRSSVGGDGSYEYFKCVVAG
jgi:hypothetical protein